MGAYLEANLFRVAVKNKPDVESPFRETGIPGDGMAKVAYTHQGYIPHAVKFQDGEDLVRQEVNVVTASLFAKFAKKGQVLTHLSRSDAGFFAKLLR